MFDARSKHIIIRYHKIRKLITLEEMYLSKVYTKENLTNRLTKPVPTENFMHYLNLIATNLILLKNGGSINSCPFRKGATRVLEGTPKNEIL